MIAYNEIEGIVFEKKNKIYVVNGPNLNLLGKRETEIYGESTLDSIITDLAKKAEKLGVVTIPFQSNHEGGIIDFLHTSGYESATRGIIINGGALSHYSYAIADAIAALHVPVIEVHLSNIYARREEFRHHSVLSSVCTGVICGFGARSYEMALNCLAII